ncbi:polysaccharide biosynthesis protein : CapK related-protein OS=Planctomyces limnophilus (strain ATCC 43296 / DSM 3776 / IFAM 1008 / 290) GN=Plim_3882 PE=4 SV=1: AMP-binding [Gemmata massiliana]|uniref:AMP-dependent synthetase/ligase domain-containing protein n=1 Tax=Gemmata massiliana TaxID=1210884 RepID=A0A6P2D2J8_9BACT|nr:phenylacetate--CoA ligase family protein [Gemmata massiliana]VTR93662.1 polysaccharide biosynthesis protein : CapK related-protein OS=Planctomyces limnophilus (strain ATCC 43296 / DSM 3776 / IFAM 1008 / 290) GN=Plim_3882 PE=4 SV=1: AMP-binding [Gemmata massiliana]
MLTWLHRNFVLRPFEGMVKGRNTFRYWGELERTQWLSRTELEYRQLESLRRLLSHSYQNCPYYRCEWDRLGLKPNTVHTLADFHDWPILTKEAIRINRAQMRSSVPGQQMIAKATGGSSGAPLQFDLNLESHERRVAATYRGYNWAGAGPGTKQFFLWGAALGDRTWKQYAKDRLYDWLNRRITINSFEFSRAKVPEFNNRLNRFRPDVIVAYTNPLYAFAQSLEELKQIPYSPRSIVVGAEKIYPFQRELIERVFRAPIFETYGAREFMIIGGECDRHAGLHLTTENLIVEVVDDQGHPTPDGEEGNVVITDLTNYGMPFVRYINGDRAVAGFTECPCGRGLPLLRKVVGRQLDMIDTPDGRRVPGEFFPHLLKDFPAVERFQVVQESNSRVEIRLVLRPGWDDTSRIRLDAELRKVLGSTIAIDVTPVASIPLTAAGKLRVVVRTSGSASELTPSANRTK